MSLTLNDFSRLPERAHVVIHSLQQALYQVTVLVEGREHLLVEPSGRAFRRYNLQQVREVLQTLPVASITLRQQSAYDEMIGQPAKVSPNTLEVSLSLDTYPDPVIH